MIKTALILALLPVAAGALCVDRAVFVEQLSTGHGETLTAGGMMGEDAIIEVFTAEDGAWTMIRTTATGVSCLMAVGTDWGQWERVTEPQGEPG